MVLIHVETVVTKIEDEIIYFYLAGNDYWNRGCPLSSMLFALTYCRKYRPSKQRTQKSKMMSQQGF